MQSTEKCFYEIAILAFDRNKNKKKDLELQANSPIKY